MAPERGRFLTVEGTEGAGKSSNIEFIRRMNGLDSIAGLRDAAARLAGGDSPTRLASAIEFILEGLHLANRLNKSVRGHGALFGRA